MAKRRATEEALGDLHETLARELKSQLTKKHHKIVKNKVGEEIGIEAAASPALLNVIRQFLKDNCIEADPKTYRKNPALIQPEDLSEFPFDGEPKH